MFEILLLKKDLKNSINLLNQISAITTHIKIYNIVSTLEECKSIIKKHHINLLLIDNNIFEHINITDYEIIHNNVQHIIILKETDPFPQSEKYIYSTSKNIVKTINNIFNSSHKNIDEMQIIFNELKFLGYNLAYYGTKYLAECIYYIFKHYTLYDENTIAEVYPIIAKKYNKNINNIKCNITRATSIMFCECEEEKLKKYLGLCTLPKTGSRLIIQTILNKLHNL